MPINNQSLNKELYKLLKVRGFDPIPKDSTGETSPVPDEADVFKFTFKQDGNALGTAWATIDGNNKLTLYYGDDITKNVSEGEDPNNDFDLSWTGFLKHLKMWAQRRQMGFDLENKDHLHSDMAQRDYTKKQEMAESKQELEGFNMLKVNEGYHPMGKSASYNDNIPTVKIVLQHTRQIQEGEQRYRNIARIYLENVQGERFLAPTNKPGIAQIYARHLAEGGSVNDERWNHIKSLCEDYGKMSGFVRAVRGNQFNESAQKLVEAGLGHYQSLRETLSKMRGHRGYSAYFESWTPTLMETEGDEQTNLNELFVQETLDPRIESVMPILNRLKINLGEMKEVNELSEWADSLLEAPGDETLAHNQATEKSRLKAFDLEEDAIDDAMAAKKKMNLPAAQRKAQGGNWKVSQKDLEKMPAGTRTTDQGLAAHAKRVGLGEEDVEESGLQAYLGNKKYGKEGMNALRKAGRDGAGKEKMANIRAKYDKLDEFQVEEGLSAEQKRVGQLGPTEKVKNNNIGKLVGANESVEQGVAEESLPKGFFNGRGFEAARFKEQGNMPMYHAAMSDQHIKYAKHFAKTNPEKAKWHGEQSEQHIKQMRASQKQGVAEGYQEPTDAAGHAKMAAKIKKILDDTLADRGDRHGNPDPQQLARAYEYHMKKAKEKSQGVAEGSLNEISQETAISYAGKRMNTDTTGKSPEKIEKMIKGLKGAVARAHGEKPTSPAKKEVKEGQEDLDAILRIIKK